MSEQAVVHAAADIEVGVHKTFEVFGVTLNADTILATVVAGLIVLALGFALRARVTAGVPGGIQLFWESVTGWVQGEVNASMGKTAPFVVPLAVTLFVFILASNWIEVIPTEEYVPPPTADVNLTYALAFAVIVWVHVHAFRRRGFDHLRHLAQPYKALLPINILEELIKPFTLALRLFGNIFASGIMVSLIGLMPLAILWGPNILWKLFAMLIGVIQAFIFALLTILYFGMGARENEPAH